MALKMKHLGLPVGERMTFSKMTPGKFHGADNLHSIKHTFAAGGREERLLTARSHSEYFHPERPNPLAKAGTSDPRRVVRCADDRSPGNTCEARERKSEGDKNGSSKAVFISALCRSAPLKYSDKQK